METRANYIAVGSFVFLFIIATVFFALWVSRIDFMPGTNLYAIYFKGAVTGLRVNEQVRFHGIEVGRVREIAIDPSNVERVKVVVSIDHPWLIREGTMASVEAQGLTGYTFVQLDKSMQSKPLLKAKPGEPYPVIQSKRSDMEALLKSMPEIVKQVKHLAERLNTFFDEKTHDNMKKILADWADISGKLAKGKGSLPETVKSVQEAMSTLNEHIQKIGPNLETMIANVGKASEEGEKLIEENRGAVKDFTHNGLPEFKRFMSDAREAMARLNRVLASFGQGSTGLFQPNTQNGYRLEE